MKRLLLFASLALLLLILGTLTVVALPRAETAATQNYNAIALPLDVEDTWADEGYTFDADGLADYIGPSVQQVLRLDAERQEFDSWYPETQDGFVGGVYTTTPFALSTGGGYWVLVDSTSPTEFSIVGDVPDAGTIKFTLVGTSPNCSNNQITVPLEQSDITNADELADSIGADDVEQVLRLNAERQDFDSWYPATGDGFVDGVYTTTPFEVRIGYPYWVCLTSGADGNVWP